MENKVEHFEKESRRDMKFSILNKFDRIWSGNNTNLPFCDLYKLIIPSTGLTDEEVSKQLTEYIDTNNIK